MKISEEATIPSIVSANDMCKFYTISGKLFKGNGEEKLVTGKRVKEDNMIFQQNAKMKLTLWCQFIDAVNTGVCYTFTHLKLNDFNGTHLTTSHWTTITTIDNDENITVPEDFSIDDDMESIQVEGIGKVGTPDTFHACGTCKEKIPESNIRLKAYTCNRCDGSRGRALLLKDQFEIDVEVVLAKKQTLSLKINRAVASTVFDLTGDQEVTTLAQEVADDLFSLIGHTLVYNTRNHMIHSITAPIEDDEE